MVKGQRWKVLERDGVIAREGPEDYCRKLPEVLPAGAVVEEQELKGNRLRFLRLSGRGPYTGWVDVREGNTDLLARVEKRAGAIGASVPVQAEDDLDGTAKRKKGSEKWRPQPQPSIETAAPPNSAFPRPGRFWKVVGAPKNGLTVWQGVSESSPLLPGTLPQGAVVEEVQVVGNRLSFTDFSMRGPPSGWVNIRENGRDMIVVDMEGLSTLNIAEALKESAGLIFPQMPQPVQPVQPVQREREETPLSGWAKLSEMYQKPLEKQRMDLAAAAAETDTAKNRARRRRRQTTVKEIPPLEELAHASEEMLVDMLGFPEEEAKHFAMMNEESKNRVITECRALIDMSPLERQMAFEKLRKAWPRGPFPSFAKPSENLPSTSTNLLPPNTCFPIKRPPKTSSAPSNLVSALDGKPGTFFAAEPEGHQNALEQKRALQGLAQKVAVLPAQEVTADPSIAAERMDFCRLPATKVDTEKLAHNVMAKTKLGAADVALYLAEEMKKRPLLLDAGPAAKLRAAGLSEADFRGERAKVLRDSASQLGNVDLLSLSKPNLVLDTHKDYLKAGADICCTNTFNANLLAQRDFKTTKFVTEMNKTAAILAKRAAAEITKQDPRKPRLVAGLIGPNSNLLLGAGRARSVGFDDLVESYTEQIKGLADGGVDLLALEAVSDAVSAKAAIYAAGEVYRQLKQRVPPMLIHAVVDPTTGRTPGGQGLDAFYVSVKHAKPLVVGFSAGSGSEKVLGAYAGLANVSQSFTGIRLGDEGQAPNSLASDAGQALKAAVPNLLGVSSSGLPAHVAALAQLQISGVPRALPEATKAMMLSGHTVHTLTDFSLVGQRGSTRASDGFKALIDEYKAKKDPVCLHKALDVCAQDAEKGADILDICVDGIANDGSNRASKAVFGKFVEMCDADDRVSKAPFMLCSSDWKCLREGLCSVQGRSVVNAICLMVGEEEFLRIAKECLKHGAAVVIMAISEEGRCVTSKDKAAVLQRSYRLLRQKLDFPPEDMILDCHLQSLRPDEHPADVIAAIAEVRRTCPYASVAAGVSNLSAAFGKLSKLREALHSVFLQHAVPKGLNVAMAEAGHLPLYSDLDKETRQRCEDVILNSGKDEAVLKSFMGFISFRSGATVCLPLQATIPKDESGQEAWWDLPECKAAAKEAQREYLEKRGPLATPALQKAFFQTLKPAHVASSGKISPDAGCSRADPCRVTSTGGSGALQQQVQTALAAGTAVGASNLLAQLNVSLGQKVLLLDGPLGPGEQLSEIKDEASFRGSRFPASAKGNLNLLSITKPDAVMNAHRALLKAGADIIRTNTLYGDALCQKYYGTEAVSYELNRAAAGLAKQAVAEAVSQNQLKYVAGVLGPSVGGISGIRPAATWDQLVQSYRPQVQGLVDGGVHLLMLDMVSDTLNAKAAIYAIEEHFSMNPKDRLPVIINVVMKDGRTASGQTLSACLASLAHAQPFAFGVGGEQVAEAARECSCWVHLAGGDPSSSVNLASPSGSKPQDVQALAAKLGQVAPRKLPASNAANALQLSSSEAMTARPEDGLKLAGQRCHVQGSHRFKGLMQAYKYSKEDDVWEAAVDVAAQQVQDEADLLDVNLDLPDFDSKLAMGKFVRRCAVHPQVSKLPLIISSVSWDVIAEGLKSTQGKCIVNGISMASSEEEFVRVAAECRRFGAAIVVLAMSRADGEFPNYQEKVTSCQRAYQLLRSKLDFPAEDIIFDCLVTPLGSHGIRASPKDFIDAVAEVKRTCPGVSFIAGVSNLGVACRSAAMLREAVASTFLQQAVPKGLNLALVELGRLPRVDSLEEPTRSMCLDVITNHAVDGQHISRFLNYGAFLSGSSAAEEAQKAKAKIANTLQPKDKSALVAVKQRAPEPLRPSPQFTHPVEILVQATGTVSNSIFQTFGSKAHAAANYHRLSSASTFNKTVHFSSISVYMGQGGSGPVTGASSLMDGLSLWERHQGINHYSTTVLWGAIGEIGLRKAIYGSRDVFAQFDLGQKLIGPADTAFLQKQVCCNPQTWDFVGLAYLDNTWQDSLGGRGGGGLSSRKTFLDN